MVFGFRSVTLFPSLAAIYVLSEKTMLNYYSNSESFLVNRSGPLVGTVLNHSKPIAGAVISLMASLYVSLV